MSAMGRSVSAGNGCLSDIPGVTKRLAFGVQVKVSAAPESLTIRDFGQFPLWKMEMLMLPALQFSEVV